MWDIHSGGRKTRKEDEYDIDRQTVSAIKVLWGFPPTPPFGGMKSRAEEFQAHLLKSQFLGKQFQGWEVGVYFHFTDRQCICKKVVKSGEISKHFLFTYPFSFSQQCIYVRRSLQ